MMSPTKLLYHTNNDNEKEAESQLDLPRLSFIEDFQSTKVW